MTFSAYLADNARRHHELPEAPDFAWADTLQRRAEHVIALVKAPREALAGAAFVAGVGLLCAGMWVESKLRR